VARIDEFELDFGRYELRLAGRRIRLAKQPTELLIVLVRKRGLLVTREEIVKLFWGHRPSGEIDAGINNAIRVIRRAFKDAADKPHFVETIPRKGYRFIGPITVMEGKPPIPVGDEKSRIPPVEERPRSLPNLWWLIALMMLVVTLVIARGCPVFRSFL
jgi:DNA-binding winged helix-turn-helix (wHTH) protein